jgi:hypothetical protein
MYGQNIVAFFPPIASAEKARGRLVEAGIDRSAIRLSNDGTSIGSGEAREDQEQGWFEWLFGDQDVPEYERNWYGENLSDGRAALSVRVASEQELSRIEPILEAEGALEVDRDDDGMAGGTMQSAHYGSTR